jgi:Protein of unknown function (DUF3489)
MDRHAPTERRKSRKTHMTTAEPKTAATVAERGAQGAPERASSKKGATSKKGAPRGRNAAKGGKAKAVAPKKEAKTPRDGSKKAKVLALLGRKEGATLAQLMKATGWQAHSVRGFLSGALGKKMGLEVTSAKSEDGERTYSIKA